VALSRWISMPVSESCSLWSQTKVFAGEHKSEVTDGGDQGFVEHRAVKSWFCFSEATE
jgi:hypothetical protein